MRVAVIFIVVVVSGAVMITGLRMIKRFSKSTTAAPKFIRWRWLRKRRISAGLKI